MKIIVCDICGKKVLPIPVPGDAVELTRHGNNLDMCVECRSALQQWMREREEDSYDQASCNRIS